MRKTVFDACKQACTLENRGFRAAASRCASYPLTLLFANEGAIRAKAHGPASETQRGQRACRPRDALFPRHSIRRMTKGAKRKQAEEPAAAAPEPKAAKKADAAPPAKKKARQAEAGPKKAAAAPSKAAAAPKKKGGSEIDAIFSIGSTAKQPADSEAELGPELKEVAERIKKAREAKGSTEAAAADKKVGRGRHGACSSHAMTIVHPHEALHRLQLSRLGHVMFLQTQEACFVNWFLCSVVAWAV